MPNVCSYSYVEHANVLYVITTLIGLHGGLSVVLRWWSPRIITVGRKIQVWYITRRQRHVMPT